MMIKNNWEGKISYPEGGFASDTDRLHNVAARVLELEGIVEELKANTVSTARLFEMQNAARDLSNKLLLVRDGLTKIACLGNGSSYGNSTGNQIAIDLIKIIDRPGV